MTDQNLANNHDKTDEGAAGGRPLTEQDTHQAAAPSSEADSEAHKDDAKLAGAITDSGTNKD